MESTINIYDLFARMVDHKIQIIYHGLFDQEMIKSVMAMTEKKLIQENIEENLKKKLFNVMIESLQNISKHQMVPNVNSNPFMMISKSVSGYSIITGNYINNDKIPVVKQKIDHVNTLDKEGLKEYYKQARLNSVISDVGGAGLGFIDMARKSGNKIKYEFYLVDKDMSLFILHNKISNN